MDDIEKKLDALLLLPANWDSYGALPVNREIVAAARQVARVLPGECPKPNVVATSRGGVSFEWSRGDDYLEMDFLGPQHIEFFRMEIGNYIQDEPCVIAVSDVDKIVELVRWFAEWRSRFALAGR